MDVTSTSFEDWTRAWQETLTTNVVGPASLSWAAANVMARQGGAIVSVSSRGAKRGEPLQSLRRVKGGVEQHGQSLAAALGGQANIAVSAVAPGFVETDMAGAVLEGPVGGAIRAQSPFGRVATPQKSPSSGFPCGTQLLAQWRRCWLQWSFLSALMLCDDSGSESPQKGPYRVDRKRSTSSGHSGLEYLNSISMAQKQC